MKKNGVQKIFAVMLCATLLSDTGYITAWAENASGESLENTQVQITAELEETMELPTGGLEIPVVEEELVIKETESQIESLKPQQIESEWEEAEVNGAFTNDYGYCSLGTVEQQNCYNVIKNAAYDFHTSCEETTERITSSGTLTYLWNALNISEYEVTVLEFQQVLFAVQADCPELFWFCGSFSYDSYEKGDEKFVSHP